MTIHDYSVKDREGNAVERFESIVTPEKIEEKVKELI